MKASCKKIVLYGFILLVALLLFTYANQAIRSRYDYMRNKNQ
jgi:hypothetical protein